VVRPYHLEKVSQENPLQEGGKMKFKTSAVLLMLVIFITGCAALMPQVPQTPRDKSAVFMSYYMAQLQDYEARYTQAELGVPTDLDIKILTIKYEFLQNAWKPIALYDSYVTSGTIPPATLEAEINGLIGMLERSLQ